MNTTFSDAQLEHIVEQGMIYMCACPSQVASALQKLRGLYEYQMRCLPGETNDATVHQVIADSAIAAHGILEQCLSRVIQLEHWDPVTLIMPEGLRRRQLQEAQTGD